MCRSAAPYFDTLTKTWGRQIELQKESDGAKKSKGGAGKAKKSVTFRDSNLVVVCDGLCHVQ